MKKLLFPLAAVALVAAPVAAQSFPAIAPIQGENELGGKNAGVVAAALIAGIIAIGVLAFSDDDTPISA